MRRSWSKLLLISAVVAAALISAAPASAGPPWALDQPTSGTVRGMVGDYRCCPNPHTHAGIDISNSTGTNIYAAYRGRVRHGSSSTAGNYIEISHPNGYMTRYLHLSGFVAANGQFVERGQHIGEMGCTGTCSGPHLHFDLRHNGGVVNTNSAYVRNTNVSAGADIRFDTFLVADLDFAPFFTFGSFIDRQYRDFLRRPADLAAAGFWIEQQWAGRSGLDVIYAIYGSPESNAKISGAVRLYYAAFGRHPDNGVKSWLNKPLTEVARGLILSNEGVNKLPENPEAFVRQVYRFAFGREAHSNEVTFWATVVRNDGRSRALVGISESNEHKERRYGQVAVNRAYIGMLDRVPDTSGRNYWVGRVQYARGYAERDMLASIRGSCEYLKRLYGPNVC